MVYGRPVISMASSPTNSCHNCNPGSLQLIIMPGYQYDGSAEVRLKVRLLGDVSSLSRVSLEVVMTPLIMDCQADHSRHIFRCGNNTPANQGPGRSAYLIKLLSFNIILLTIIMVEYVELNTYKTYKNLT